MTSDKMGDLIREHKPDESAHDDTAAMARQPILDLAGNIWAYELLFRDPAKLPGFGGKTSHAATSSVMVNGFEIMRPTLRPGQRFFINFTEEMIEAELASILPPETCVLEILETVHPTDSVIRSLTHLKEQGYMLALDDFVGQKELVRFISMVDILKVEVLGRTPAQLRRLVNALGFFQGRLLAEKVEDYETVRLCKQLNFTLFQGWFFCKAEVVQGKKLTPSQITKARLLTYSASDMEDDFEKIGESISADVYLSYKLLRYVNSAYFGLPMRIGNVDHAITLLGWVKLRQWLCVTALAEMDSAPMARELVILSALRAKFLELLASQCQSSGVEKGLPRSLFLIGLFSFLDSMLQMPMAEILSALPLNKPQVDALAHRTGPYAPWLDMVEAYERGEWERACGVALEFGLSYSTLGKAYAEASCWSASFFADASSR